MHQSCYGIQYLPEEDWICNLCLVYPKEEINNIECCLCSIGGGAMKLSTLKKNSALYKKIWRLRGSSLYVFNKDYNSNLLINSNNNNNNSLSPKNNSNIIKEEKSISRTSKFNINYSLLYNLDSNLNSIENKYKNIDADIIIDPYNKNLKTDAMSKENINNTFDFCSEEANNSNNNAKLKSCKSNKGKKTKNAQQLSNSDVYSKIII